MKVEEEEMMMMKKKKNDDEEEEEQGEQIIIIVGMCWGTLNAPPDQYKHTETRKNTSCTIEAIMKHMLMPIKNFCIQSLCENVS